jgi:hypothetical protein
METIYRAPRGRSLTTVSLMERQSSNHKVRVITYAWGRDYVDELLSLTLPAVLADGNLSALVDAFDCEFLLLTETRLFDLIKNSDAYARISAMCPSILKPLDDLIAPAGAYGVTLTCVLYRAFEDLGEHLLNTTLVFFNADWILAAGSYESLAKHIREGQRLIVAPSYCVVAEEVKPLLHSRLTGSRRVLSVPKREMAELAIRHRHNTIRGKTLNEPYFHMDVIDQFYWKVDTHTFLARQMPIAIVSMRPKRFALEPRTFWDYGTVSELCPNTTPVVLADSDEFLMIELRSGSGYSSGLAMGWPSDAEIARQLGSFQTKDHRDYGKFTLTLHSRELPEYIGAAKKIFDARVSSIRALMPKDPLPHNFHPYWNAYWPYFSTLTSAFRAVSNRAHYPTNSDVHELAQIAIRLLRERLKTVQTHLLSDQAPPTILPEWGSKRAEISAELSSLGHAVNYIESVSFNKVAALRKEIANISLLLDETDAKINIRSRDHTQAYYIVPFTKTSTNSPPYRWWNIDAVMIAPIIRAAQKVKLHKDSKVLTIVGPSAGPVADAILAMLEGEHFRLSSYVGRSVESQLIAPKGTEFDICVFDLDHHDIWFLSDLLERIRPFVAPRAQIWLYFKPPTPAWVESWNAIRGEPEFVKALFQRIEKAEMYLVDGCLLRLAIQSSEVARRLLQRLPLLGSVLATAVSAPLAWLGYVFKTDHNCIGQKLPRRFLSLTMIFELESE